MVTVDVNAVRWSDVRCTLFALIFLPKLIHVKEWGFRVVPPRLFSGVDSETERLPHQNLSMKSRMSVHHR